MAWPSGKQKGNKMASSAGYCYSDASPADDPTTSGIQAHLAPLQGFDSSASGQEIYNLTTGMEEMGFPTRTTTHHQQQGHESSSSLLWKRFFNKPHHNYPGAPSSSSKLISLDGGGDFYNDEFNKPDFTVAAAISHEPGTNGHHHQNLMGTATDSGAWPQESSRLLAEDPSLRYMFSVGGNQRPHTQGLSLSLSSCNPSTIGLQTFELRHQQEDDDLRFFPSSSLPSSGEGLLAKSMTDVHHHHHEQHQQQPQIHIRGSKYLVPVQELLNEFCSLGTNENNRHPSNNNKPHKALQWEDDKEGSSSRKPPLHTLELLELQKRKTRLLHMLEEIETRYRHYCEQMKALVSTLEIVAGNGAARAYSTLASKAMSRHFRCLKDGILDEIKATRKAIGDKGGGRGSSPGTTTRGETPRLRILDQTLRQQRAFNQYSMMESHPWRPQRGLPERSVSILRAWLFEHFLHPYPSDVDKHILARQTGLSRSQVSNWFINARVRLWKPMVEEMYLEEIKDQDTQLLASSDGGSAGAGEDQKPALDRMLDSECLSSVVNNPDKNDQHHKRCKGIRNEGHNHSHHHHHHHYGTTARISEPFGAIELDFSSNEIGGRGAVSLTLGLQQDGGGNGMKLAFSTGAQGSLFYGRDAMEECQQGGEAVQYSFVEGDHQGQNLPYRSLVGAQLLHDLAG